MTIFDIGPFGFIQLKSLQITCKK